MGGPHDPLLQTLTGELPFVILASALLALPLSFFLLWLYRRAVRRSMRSRSGVIVPVVPPARASSPPPHNIELSFDGSSLSSPLPLPTQSVIRQIERGPWQAAAVYAAAGAGYALVMAIGWLAATHDAFKPLKFLWLFWSYVWPAVLTVNLVAGSTRRGKACVLLAYFAVLAVLGAIVLMTSPKLTLGQLIFGFWLVINGPPTVLLFTFLLRRIRAVGPMVITFVVVGVLGAEVAVDVARRSNRILRLAADVAVHLRLSGTAMFWVLLMMGFAIFGLVGWPLLRWVRWRYEHKRISDQSLACDSICFLFGIFQSIYVAFEGWWWIFTGLAGFVVYKCIANAGFFWQRRGRKAPAPKLLLLRVFSLGRRSEKLFSTLGKHWLRAGSIRMIAGPDLATSTVEPHEFLDFVSGKLARRFIDGPATLDLRLRELDTRPDWDGRFRVTDFFCYADTWKMVLARLIGESDAVLMDLRGFTRRNAGCSYEIEELLSVAPLERVVIVVDRTTDMAFLEEVVKTGWSTLRTNSPNRERESRRLKLLRFAGSSSQDLQQLLQRLCLAVEGADTQVSEEGQPQADRGALSAGA